MENKEHRSKTISAIKWNMVNQVASQVMIFVTGIVLMRELSPADFGLMGMVGSVTGLLVVINNFGINSSLIHKEEIDELDKHVVFWFSVLLGLFLAGLMVVSSPAVAAFFSEPTLQLMLVVLSLNFMLLPLSSVHMALLRKHLENRKIFIIGISSVLISSVVALILAFNGFGVWALIIQQLIANSIMLTLCWVFESYRPKLQFDKAVLDTHLGFAFPILGSKIFSYLINNADTILVGKFLGAGALGFYSRSYSIVTVPARRIGITLSGVMFPSFSLIQKNTERIKHIYLKVSRVLFTIISFLMGGLFITIEFLVNEAFGDRWLPIVSVIQALTIVAALKSASELTSNVLLAKGKTKLDFKLNVINGLIILAGFAIGVFFDIVTVAIIYVITVAIITIPKLMYTGRLIDCSLWENLANLFAPAMAAILAVLMVMLFDGMMEIDSSRGLIAFFVSGSLYTIVWLLIFWLTAKEKLMELLNLRKTVF